MVPYSLSTNARYGVYLFIFFLALFLHNLVLRAVAQSSEWSFVVGSITLLTIVTILYYLLNHFFWRLPAKIGYPLIPDFNGVYFGYIVDRHSYKSEPACPGRFLEVVEHLIPVEVTIEQTFADLGIWLTPAALATRSQTRNASDCTMAIIDVSAPRRPQLQYAFQVRPTAAGQPPINGLGFFRLSHDGQTTHLDGHYVSDAMRKARLELVRPRSNRSKVLFRPVRVLGQTETSAYIGVSFERNDVQDYIDRLTSKLGKKRFKTVDARRFDRDGDNFHLTIIEPEEYRRLSSDTVLASVLTTCISSPAMVELLTIGRQAKLGTEAFFIIAISTYCAKIRDRLGLPPKDFHVTLGFDPEDLHGVPKDMTTKF